MLLKPETFIVPKSAKKHLEETDSVDWCDRITIMSICV